MGTKILDWINIFRRYNHVFTIKRQRLLKYNIPFGYKQHRYLKYRWTTFYCSRLEIREISRYFSKYFLLKFATRTKPATIHEQSQNFYLFFNLLKWILEVTVMKKTVKYYVLAVQYCYIILQLFYYVVGWLIPKLGPHVFWILQKIL